jgi:hypothetical protein
MPVSQMVLSLPPPQSWEEFEQLTLDVCKREWQDPDLILHGRRGQDQNGVDVFGFDRVYNRHVGVQCKKLEPGKKLSETIIRNEIDMVKGFRQQLDHFIIATTAPRDTHTQSIIHNLNQERRRAGTFGVSAWFWDDFQGRINRHAELLYLYYETVLRSLDQYDPQKHYLMLLKAAFTRPAFDTMLDNENRAEDLLQAIVDTQEAVNFGRLKDREDRSLVRSAPSGIESVRDSGWRKRLEQMSGLLAETRDSITTALRDKHIQQDMQFIYVQHPPAARKLNRLRRKAVELLNGVLAEAGIEPVQSRLLQIRQQ